MQFLSMDLSCAVWGGLPLLYWVHLACSTLQVQGSMYLYNITVKQDVYRVHRKLR
jgi:hypothetical protein